MILDALWIGVLAKSFYQKHLGYLFAEKFTLWPAGIFYLIYAFGIMFFVVNPGIQEKSAFVVFYRGALLGLIAYAAYDLTNQATINKWPVVITIVDLLWGAVVTALVGLITYFIVTKIQ